MRRTIMGIPVDAVTRAEAVERIRRFLEEPRAHFVTTPNPEMLVDARHDPAFREALGAADLAIPDGHGLVFVSRIKGPRIPERITGTDIVQDIARLAATRRLSIFLLGGEHGEGELAMRTLQEAHHGLRIVGTLQCGKLTPDAGGVWHCSEDAVAAVRNAAPDILLVAFGHRKQETWIRAHLHELPSVRLAIGVGGAFNFLAGRSKRAPTWMRALWLEWLWRLLQEPKRLKRIIKAAIVFPLLALSSRD
jgi:N-acetylglucosaminyldiphosphoundecaprenol N-acetyl-beta-D-mannosaminyltransferase